MRAAPVRLAASAAWALLGGATRVCLLALVAVGGGCERRADRPGGTVPAGDRGAGELVEGPPPAPPLPPPEPLPEPPAWAVGKTLGEAETLVLSAQGAEVQPTRAAKKAGLLNVDLSDEWAPFILSDSDGAEHAVVKPNGYRKVFVDLANDRVDPDQATLANEGPTRRLEIFASPEAAEAARVAARVAAKEEARKKAAGEKRAPRPRRPAEPVRNYLEPFGIPPTLTVLLRRLEEDLDEGRRRCYHEVDREGLTAASEAITYNSQKEARHDYDVARADREWYLKYTAADAGAGGAALGAAAHDGGAAVASAEAKAKNEARTARRLERYHRGQARLRAVSALQARLLCEGLLTPRDRFVRGMFDLATHTALAAWERKNDLYGWGFLGGEARAALLRPPMELHLETWKRILTERIADAAGILEDGSALASGGGKGANASGPPTYKDQAGHEQLVPNLIGDHVQALQRLLGIATPGHLVVALRALGAETLGRLHVAFPAPALPPYYSADMELEAEIDRGDIHYEFPFDARGRPIDQVRERYPSLGLFVRWNKQRIPLARWRTTIGSWRSELRPDGKVYYRYKNSDVGPRIWRTIVAAPVWVPPEGTVARDLLARKEFDRNVGPVTVVDTDVMGPGFQSAYGLGLAVHNRGNVGDGPFDNGIRTHGSVDYTSIARRFSHGCHRLVNPRAVRLFGFVLRRRAHDRVGQLPLGIKKYFTADEQKYGFELGTRGYYFELKRPIPINVLEGRIMGKLQKPITDYVRKPGVDYSDVEAEGSVEASALGAP